MGEAIGKIENMKEFNNYSFDDGAKVATEILSLITTIQPELEARCSEFLNEDQLTKFYENFTKETSFEKGLNLCMQGVFSKLIKPTELNSRFLNIWGLDSFWKNQNEIAPICEISSSLGFIQFGDWIGKSDGDAWIFDMEYSQIAVLSIDLLDYDAETVRLYSYETFQSPWEWLSYLREEASKY